MPEELKIVIEDSTAAAGGTPGALVSPQSPAASDSGTPGQRQVDDVGATEAAATARVGASAAGVSTTAALAVASVAAAATAVAVGFSVAAAAAAKFAQVIESQVDRLAAFSPDVAVAQAQTELRREHADRRRAAAIGPELASAERLRGRFEDVMAELGDQTLKVLLSILGKMDPILEGILSVIEWGTEFLPQIIQVAVESVLSAIGLNQAIPLLRAIWKRLPEFGDDGDRLVDGMDPFAAAFAGEAFRLPPQLKGFNPYDVPIAAPRLVPPPDVNAGRRGGP